MPEPSTSCSTEKFLACASALPTDTLNVVRRSRRVTSAGSPKVRSVAVRKLPGPVGRTTKQRLALKAGQRGAKAPRWRGPERSDIEGTEHLPQVTRGRRRVPVAVRCPGLLPVGEQHDRARAVVAKSLQDAVGVHGPDPGQVGHPGEGGALGQ